MAATDVAQALYQAPTGWLQAAVDALVAAGVQVVAPTEEEPGIVNLAPVTSADAIALGCVNVLLPLKRLFFPETEVLLEFEKHGDGDVEIRPRALAEGERVVIGCRPCDAAALDLVDRVFQWDYDDVRYRAQRERTTLVSFACAEPDVQCFCTSVGGSPHSEHGSDVLVFPSDGDQALIQVLTDKGQRLIDRLGDALQPAPDGAERPEAPLIQPRFDPDKVKTWLDENFENDFWMDVALRCLGCGACTYLCPTCHCFDIIDESTWNRGQRRRNWDCCSFALFTLHASGHNPRPDQMSRCRQRVMHKFKYFPGRFGRAACVGCGRCVRTCGAGQSLVRVLAQIEARIESGDLSRG